MQNMVVCKGELLLCEMVRKMSWGYISSRTQRHNPVGWGSDVQAVQGSQAADFTARKHRPLATKTH